MNPLNNTLGISLGFDQKRHSASHRNRQINSFHNSCFFCRLFFLASFKKTFLDKKKSLVFITILFLVSFDVFSQANISFHSSGLIGENLINPTSLQFGPDNRLYVSQQNGSILAFSIQKNGPNNYEVTATETIDIVKSMPNHNDDGTPHNAKVQRQITGILLTGSPSNPVLYVTSSDYRIGGGGTKGDLNLDTNSGIISRITWTGSNWDKVDLVRGLPRSEENHSNNGLQYNSTENRLYVAMGGNTNAGAPSNNFAFITEYALSAAIITIDLTVIEALPIRGTGNNKYIYDLPTLDDPARPNINNPDYNPSLPGSPLTIDENDPFGGNDGLNQAKIILDGPVQIYSPGYRNAYDLVFTKSPGKEGRLYTIDNGANGGWGGYPENEGASGDPLTTSVTNNYVLGEPGSTGPGENDAKVNNLDNLHLVSAPGMTPIYGGHPCPIRANPSGAGLYWFDNDTDSSHFELNPTADWPPVPISMANPIEGDYQNPGIDDNALYTWVASTNGLAEYTSSKYFDGELEGDLLAASYNGEIFRIKLNSNGTSVISSEVLANGFGANPLDLTAPGPGELFEGTIWAATYGANAITIFEPEGGATWKELPTADGSGPTARHENGYVEAGGKFYLIGGRGNKPMEIYDPSTNSWTTGATPPLQFHHFQAIEFEGQIYVIGAFVGTFPNESPVPNIYIYNPATDAWAQGPEIPTARRRGSAGVVKYNDKIYIVGGIINGHTSGWVPWLDEFDPADESWVQLPDAPRERDHFQAIRIDEKIYAVGGRQSGKIGTFVPMIAEVDVYDFSTNSWFTLPPSANLPTLRAGTTVAAFNNELLVIGGESTQQIAHNDTQALDLASNTWRTLGPLKTGRHGTQAISYEGKIYITTGSGGQGSNPELSTQETFISLVTTCTGDNSNYALDDDNDGYSNGDETDNGTNPCSAASTPTDNDFDFVSDLNDTDDDNDGLPDTHDAFALDNQNGTANNLPIDYPFLNGVPGTGLFGLGFTGLMTNNTSNYSSLYDPAHPDLIMGGAVGLASFEANSGDALTNDQQNGFQLGVNVNSNSPSFTIQSRILGAPYFNGIPLNQLGNQSLGIYIGSGDQDNYLKIVLAANNGNPGIQVLAENNGATVVNNIFPVANILASGEIDVFLEVNPQTGSIQPKYSLNGSEEGIDIGSPIVANGPLLDAIQNAPALAVGLIATAGSSSNFVATWDYIKIYNESLAIESRINAGGGALVFNEEVWLTDQYADAGSTYANPIAIDAAQNDQLYQTERSGTTFNYNIPVSHPGAYIVRLHFAEIYHGVKNPNGVGARVFNVDIEDGQRQLLQYDILEKAGAPAKAVVETFNIIVTDGYLSLAFTTIKNKAKISGIEILATEAPSNLPPILVNPGNQTFNEGQAVNLPIQAHDPDGDSFTFSQSGLPASLNIDSNTGLISGTLEASAGDYPTIVTATDTEGSSQIAFTIHVSDGTVSEGLYHINAGGLAYNFNGASWLNDQFYDAGSIYTNNIAIAATSNDQLYKSERSGITFGYNLPVNGPGPFIVKLHFAEIFHGVKNSNSIGARIFNVDIEDGQGQLLNYDILAQAGQPATAIVESFNNVYVNDDTLTIAFTTIKNKAKISGIEVLAISSAANQPPVVVNPGNQVFAPAQEVHLQIQASDADADVLTFAQAGLPAPLTIAPGTGLITGTLAETTGVFPVTISVSDGSNTVQIHFDISVVNDEPVADVIRLNSGGLAFNFNQEEWQIDQFANAGNTFFNNISIAGTTNDALYQSERNGNLTYNIPVNNGTYTAKLHFAEIFHGIRNTKAIGARVFNVDIEDGQGVLQNYDIIEQAGATATAVTEVFENISVSDGNLSITFTTVVNNAKISGIEVIPDNKSNSVFGNTPHEANSPVKEGEEKRFMIYPNPAPNHFKIKATTKIDEKITVSLFNEKGKHAQLGDFLLRKGTTVLDFDLIPFHLANGLYYLKIQSDKNDPETLKMIIQR